MAKVYRTGNILFATPWKMYAEYEDGEMLYFYGDSEEDCIEEIAAAEERHGKCTMYTGVNDKDYADGEYIGRENFIYD